jgi:hypothetical protein
VTICTPPLAAESEIVETGEDGGVAVTVTVIESGCTLEDNVENPPLWPAGGENGSAPMVAREEPISLDDGPALAVEGAVGVMVIVPVNGVRRPEAGGRVYVSA